jgi:type VI secretion system secreted protein Hcp
MAVNAFMNLGKAKGESIQGEFKDWIEIQGWDWEIEAETSWTKGGGASVGKPNPGKMNWEHYFDKSSSVIMGYICSGKAFPEVVLKMCKTTGKAKPEVYFTMTMKGAFITKVSNSGTEEGNVAQKVEMVFKTVKIEYKPQDNINGSLLAPTTYEWDIPAGISSPND